MTLSQIVISESYSAFGAADTTGPLLQLPAAVQFNRIVIQLKSGQAAQQRTKVHGQDVAG
jgi:hypothetical protein